MKRKVIQIADSTQLVSLPRKWCLQNSIKKGDELEVEVDGSKVIISCRPDTKLERAEISMRDYGPLVARVLHALYKRGVDEIKVTFEKPDDIILIQSKIKNETVGYEIVEQDSRGCVIRNISSSLLGFDTMLRRTFLLLINMADECAQSLARRDVNLLKNILNLEESNNRFTSLCRRYLNKYGAPDNQKVGPLYRIIEELENIADEYKYLIQSISRQGEETKVSKEMVLRYETLSQMLRLFYDAFYKFDAKKVTQIGEMRKKLVDDWHHSVGTVKGKSDLILLHHSVVIVQKIFNQLGPLFVLQLGSDQV